MNKDTFVDAIWFVPDDRGDTMACLWRDADGVWRFDLRIRTKLTRGEDRKSWMRARLKKDANIPEERERCRTTMKNVADLSVLTGRGRGTVEEVVCDCAGDAAAEKLLEKKWAHVVPTQAEPEGGAQA